MSQGGSLVSSGGGSGGASTAFMGYLATSAAGVIGGGIAWTIVGFTESFDIGSNFDPITGIFTAPTTGIYYLGCTVNVTNFGATNTIIDIAITLSSGITLQPTNNINPFLISTSNNMGFEGGSLVSMVVGTTAKVQIFASGSAYDVFGTLNNAYTNFYGYKVA